MSASSDSMGVSTDGSVSLKQYTFLTWSIPYWTSADHSTGYQLSACGRYSVCKVKMGELQHYEAWRCADKRDHTTRKMLGIRQKLEEAKTVCEIHANA